MSKIIDEKQAAKISKSLKKSGHKIVLAGGCFDIIHAGHIRFLKTAKEYGVVFILLESDQAIKKHKGEKRPLNSQEDRAEILSSISSVDYVVKLEGVKNDLDYDKIVLQIEPNLIVTTKGDRALLCKEKQAKLVDAKVIEIIERVKHKSSSSLGKLIKEI